MPGDSHHLLGQILHPTGRGATPGGQAAAASTPFTLMQVVQPRGPSAPAAEATMPIDSAQIPVPAPV
jgi:hypothetical protein